MRREKEVKRWDHVISWSKTVIGVFKCVYIYTTETKEELKYTEMTVDLKKKKKKSYSRSNLSPRCLINTMKGSKRNGEKKNDK